MVSAAHINVLLGHMVHSQRAFDCEDADPPMIVLRRLLRGTLAPLADKFALDDILAATRIVNRSTAIAEKEILMVAPEFFDDFDDDDEDDDAGDAE